MKNKKVRDVVIAIGILLLIILLALGVFLMTRKKESTSNGAGDKTEATMVIQEKNTGATWEKEEFEDETTDQEEPTTVQQKGGSETLGIVLPKDTVEEEKADSTEIQWQDGIW